MFIVIRISMPFICKGCHISDLPVEVLRYIFRWVVSSLLDMKALEQVAMVRKFFLSVMGDRDMYIRTW